MKERITATLAKTCPPPQTGNRIIYDDSIQGFGLRVTAAGARSFILNYFIHARERRLTIGKYPAWSAAAARERALELRRAVDAGKDPLHDREQKRQAATVRDLWDRYSDDHLALKADRSQKDEQAMFRTYINPAIGAMKVADVTHSDIDALHRSITKEDKPYRANRVIEVLRKAFNLGVRWGWRSDNPVSGTRKNPEAKRERYLKADEMARLLAALDSHPERTSADAIKLMMFTGARRGEVLNARWDQFDLSGGIWTKPAATTKQRREHRVPISAEARALLVARRDEAESPFVFPGKDDDHPLTDVKRTWATVCGEAEVSNCRLHDLRHTFASILASNGQSLPIIGALLGHTQPQTTARYAHLFDDPLRAAADMVGSSLGAVSKQADASASHTDL